MAYWAIITIPIIAASLCSGVLLLLLPWLKSAALSHPVDRSLHREPTPQGGGLGVVLATLIMTWAGALLTGPSLSSGTLTLLSALTGAVALLTLVGLMDDIRALSPAPRLLVQFSAVGLVILFLPDDARLVSALPFWVERACLVLFGVWFVNLVNFMDGIDWMTVAETVPIAGSIAIFGLAGIVPPIVMLVALALFGAMIGFAPLNRPVAQLFLGDVGSLPIGLLLGWLLLLLATSGHLAAAVLLPLYYLADASATLLLRIRRGETLWKAHRTHFYQRAVAAGVTVPAVIARVFATNLALAALAMISVAAGSTMISLLCLFGGAAIVGLLLAHFASMRQ